MSWANHATAAALLEAGADPTRVLAPDFTIGRLAQVTPLAPLFEGRVPPLTKAERAEHEEADRLIAAFKGVSTEGLGIAFVGGLDEQETIRRLGGDPSRCPVLDLVNEPGPSGTGLSGFDPDDYDEALHYAGITAAPGGCVLTQPMGYEVSTHDVLRTLSRGTVAAGMYFNPKGSTYGLVTRDGHDEVDQEIGWDPGPGSPRDHWLFRFWQSGKGTPYGAREIAYLAHAAGVHPNDATPVAGPPNRWFRLTTR